MCLHLISPQSQGLFKGVILESPVSCDTSILPAALAMQTNLTSTHTSLVGCNLTTSAARLSCLRSVPAAEFLAINNVTGSDFAWQVVLNGFDFPNPTQAFSTGAFARVPVISGIDHDEYALLYKLYDPPPLSYSDPTFYSGNTSSHGYAPLIAAANLSLFDSSVLNGSIPFRRSATSSAGPARGRLPRAVRSARLSVLIQRRAAGGRVQHPAAVGFPRRGADNTPSTYNLIQALSTAELALRDTMRSFWLNFAFAGNPNPAVGATATWPVHTAANDAALSSTSRRPPARGWGPTPSVRWSTRRRPNTKATCPASPSAAPTTCAPRPPPWCRAVCAVIHRSRASTACSTSASGIRCTGWPVSGTTCSPPPTCGSTRFSPSSTPTTRCGPTPSSRTTAPPTPPPNTFGWTHPGTYLTAIGVKLGDGIRLLAVSSRYADGMARVLINEVPLGVGESHVSGRYTVRMVSTHVVTVSHGLVSFSLVNSDGFFNIEQPHCAVRRRSQRSTGCSGQAPTPPSAWPSSTCCSTTCSHSTICSATTPQRTDMEWNSTTTMGCRGGVDRPH